MKTALRVSCLFIQIIFSLVIFYSRKTIYGLYPTCLSVLDAAVVARTIALGKGAGRWFVFHPSVYIIMVGEGLLGYRSPSSTGSNPWPMDV